MEDYNVLTLGFKNMSTTRELLYSVANIEYLKAYMGKSDTGHLLVFLITDTGQGLINC